MGKLDELFSCFPVKGRKPHQTSSTNKQQAQQQQQQQQPSELKPPGAPGAHERVHTHLPPPLELLPKAPVLQNGSALHQQQQQQDQQQQQQPHSPLITHDALSRFNARMSTSNPLFNVLNRHDSVPSSSGADSAPGTNINTVAQAMQLAQAPHLQGNLTPRATTADHPTTTSPPSNHTPFVTDTPPPAATTTTIVTHNDPSSNSNGVQQAPGDPGAMMQLPTNLSPLLLPPSIQLSSQQTSAAPSNAALFFSPTDPNSSNHSTSAYTQQGSTTLTPPPPSPSPTAAATTSTTLPPAPPAPHHATAATPSHTARTLAFPYSPQEAQTNHQDNHQDGSGGAYDEDDDDDQSFVSCAESFTSAVSAVSELTDTTSNHLAAALLALEEVQHAGPRGGVTPREGLFSQNHHLHAPSKALAAVRAASGLSNASSNQQPPQPLQPLQPLQQLQPLQHQQQQLAGTVASNGGTSQDLQGLSEPAAWGRTSQQPPTGGGGGGGAGGAEREQHHLAGGEADGKEEDRPSSVRSSTPAVWHGGSKVQGAAAAHADMLRTVAKIYRQHGHPCGACQGEEQQLEARRQSKLEVVGNAIQEILRYCSRHDVPYEDIEKAVALVVTRSSTDALPLSPSQAHHSSTTTTAAATTITTTTATTTTTTTAAIATTTAAAQPLSPASPPGCAAQAAAASASAAAAASAAVSAAAAAAAVGTAGAAQSGTAAGGATVGGAAVGVASAASVLLSSPPSFRGLTRQMRDDLQRLVRAARQMSVAMHKVLDDAGWQVVQDDHLKMMYQHQAGTTVHSFKGRCILESPVENLVALTREFDLCKTWNHYCVESVVLKEYSPAEVLCVAATWLPWPLPNMNVVVEAVGTDLLDTHGGFLITFSTPSNAHEPSLKDQFPAAIRSNPQIAFLTGSAVFFEPLPPSKPGGPQRTRATLEARVDPGLKHVPAFLITFVLKVLGPFVYNIVVKLLHKEFGDPTKPLPSRIPTRPHLYGLVREHADAYLADAQRRGKTLPQPLVAPEAGAVGVEEGGKKGAKRTSGSGSKAGKGKGVAVKA